MAGIHCCSKLLLAFLLAVALQQGQAQLTKICALSGYSVDDLKIPRYVSVDVSTEFGCPGQRVGESCKMYLSFCQPLPNNTYAEGSCRYKFGQDYSACIVVANDTDAPEAVGQYNTTVDPFEARNDDDQGRRTFAANFPNGKALGISCAETNTIVELNCDESAKWTRYYRHDSADPTIIYAAVTPLLESFYFEPTACFVYISLRYSGACAIPSNPFQGDFGLPIDIGWILVIILALLAIAYVGIGALINVIRGKRTFDTIFPNYSFWMAFVTCMLEGFKLTFDIITCWKCSKRLDTKDGKYEKM